MMMTLRPEWREFAAWAKRDAPSLAGGLDDTPAYGWDGNVIQIPKDLEKPYVKWDAERFAGRPDETEKLTKLLDDIVSHASNMRFHGNSRDDVFALKEEAIRTYKRALK